MSSAERFPVPRRLAENCRRTPEQAAWLERLPEVVHELAGRWNLRVAAPYDGTEGGAAWVAPVTLEDGGAAVLKVSLPHKEADHEIDGLRVWNGDGTVRLLAADEGEGAMLLERCVPGTPLRDLPEDEQDVVIATLLRRLWLEPPPRHPFRPLAAMTAAWSDGARRRHAAGAGAGDEELLEEGLRLFEELPRTAERHVLLATDLHAGNVLRAEREPWLVIDPKPFVGDPAYDATQHLLNTQARVRRDPQGTVRRLADLLGVDPERVRLWLFARLAVGAPEGDPAAAAGLARAVGG